jgi:hypothetical protein
VRAVSSPSAKLASAITPAEPAGAVGGRHAVPGSADQNGSDKSGPSVTLLPRRNPGSSGITDVPAPPAEQQPQRHRRELATPWWENGQQTKESPEPQPVREQTPAASDTSAFFAARSQSGAARPETLAAKPAPIRSIPEGPTAPVDDDVIYRRMLSEMLGDPYDLVNSPDLDWQSVWDRGWSLAAAAEDKPVESHTAEHGLPVRTPGARLVPGAANGTGLDEEGQPDPDNEGDRGSLVGSNAVVARDPEAVRASFSNHFGGVRSARSHARDASEGSDQQ